MRYGVNLYQHTRLIAETWCDTREQAEKVLEALTQLLEKHDGLGFSITCGVEKTTRNWRAYHPAVSPQQTFKLLWEDMNSK